MPVKYSGGQWMHTEVPINFTERLFTVESIFVVEGTSNNPTIICMPKESKWSQPVYRLGLHKETNRPEFQISLKGNNAAISVVAKNSIEHNKITHLAGTYNGKEATLYVNGEKSSSIECTGEILQSNEPVVFGGRSKSDNGGYFVGSVYEIRLMKCVRTPEEIKAWSNKRMLTPKEVKVWKGPTPPAKQADLKGLWQTW